MKKTLIITIHAIFWIVYWLLAYTVSYSRHETTSEIGNLMVPMLINFGWSLIAFYVTYFYLNKYIEQKRFVYYGIVIILFSLVLDLSFFLFYKIIYLPEASFLSIRFFFQTSAGTFIIANCGSLVRGFAKWIDEMQLRAELEKSNMKHELETLKAQLNPHFLFNTLNNIDSLIFKDQNKASESLIKLSGILQYMLYDTEQQHVQLSKEVEHISNIISLQQLRYKEKDAIRFFSDIPGNHVISPLLFTPFIENAFKHSVKTGTMPIIDIVITTNGSTIRFYCSNTFNPNGEKQTNKNGGLGLKNVKRRLELLYPDKYVLDINTEKDIFTIKLEITTK